MATRIAGKFEPSARLTPANMITLFRLVATVPVLLLIDRLGASWVTVAAWLVVASTDFLDGWVARRQGTTTSGAFLDPLADKVLVIGALAMLAQQGVIGWAPVGLIVGRELAISAYRSLVARHGVSVPARTLAKLKTAAQDGAIGLLLLPPIGRHHAWIGQDLLWVAVVLALVSGAQYLVDAWRAPALSAAGAPLDKLSGT
jgi:CDP-diacylglycerol---glycerol-3-phosphate 3-phosphatidyltransferase